MIIYKDILKKLSNAGYNTNRLRKEALPEKNKDHNLSGNYANKRECHILPDWLLVYRVEGNELVLYRTGTHSDLFKK